MSLPDLRVEFRTKKLPGGAADKKALVMSYLVRTTDVLAIERRAPDRWEAAHVFAAIGALQAGYYRLAATHVGLAIAPPEERAEEWRDPASDVTRQQLEHAIQCERQRPPAPDA